MQVYTCDCAVAPAPPQEEEADFIKFQEQDRELVEESKKQLEEKRSKLKDSVLKQITGRFEQGKFQHQKQRDLADQITLKAKIKSELDEMQAQLEADKLALDMRLFAEVAAKKEAGDVKLKTLQSRQAQQQEQVQMEFKKKVTMQLDNALKRKYHSDPERTVTPRLAADTIRSSETGTVKNFSEAATLEGILAHLHSGCKYESTDLLECILCEKVVHKVHWNGDLMIVGGGCICIRKILPDDLKKDGMIAKK